MVVVNLDAGRDRLDRVGEIGMVVHFLGEILAYRENQLGFDRRMLEVAIIQRDAAVMDVRGHQPSANRLRKGKLPAEIISQDYELEYGTDSIEMHKDSIAEGAKVLLVDDLLATGGTALAAVALIEKLGGSIAEMCFVVNLPDVGGEKKLVDKGYKIFSLTEFEGE